MTEIVELGLAPASVETTREQGRRTVRTTSHFLDWTIDGESLRRRIPAADNWVTPFHRPWEEHVPETVDSLLGRRVDPDREVGPGRAGVLLCFICGEVDVSAALDLGPTTVTWSGLRWRDVPDDQEPFVEGVPATLTFDRSRYEALLASAPARLAALPESRDEVELRPPSGATRRFRARWGRRRR
ncbi:hypothetical protein ACFFKU_06520 [Kineococcus gynurae]|uniref:Uncharacterized protein n=1 Tax=Kineococcus gynurae TaxID=452979 RepID=A0ABV5LX42_9ACTN